MQIVEIARTEVRDLEICIKITFKLALKFLSIFIDILSSLTKHQALPLDLSLHAPPAVCNAKHSFMLLTYKTYTDIGEHGQERHTKKKIQIQALHPQLPCPKSIEHT